MCSSDLEENEAAVSDNTAIETEEIALQEGAVRQARSKLEREFLKLRDRILNDLSLVDGAIEAVMQEFQDTWDLADSRRVLAKREVTQLTEKVSNFLRQKAREVTPFKASRWDVVVNAWLNIPEPLAELPDPFPDT